MVPVVLSLLLGLTLLIVGAQLVVRGAGALAAAAGVPPLVVGLTVVAYGTSAPELFVSLQSALDGQPDIALGNAVGSNIFNVLLILGVAALITPLGVSRRLIQVDVPLLIGLSLLLALLAADGTIGRIDGSALLAGLVAYTLFTVVQGRREEAAAVGCADRSAGAAASNNAGKARANAHTARSIALQVAIVIGGVVLLIFGSRVFTDAAIGLARSVGMPELVIALSIVAAGTSLPEITTSVIAAWRGQGDLAVGNVVGSNLFNILGVVGASGALAPVALAVSDSALWFDLPVMIATSIACLPVFFTGHRIARWEGALFIAYFGAYLGYRIVTAAELSQGVSWLAMLSFVLPPLILTLLIGIAQYRD